MKFDAIFKRLIIETPWVELPTTTVFDLELEKIKTQEGFIDWIGEVFQDNKEVTDKYGNTIKIDSNNIEDVINRINEDPIFQNIVAKYELDFPSLAYAAYENSL
jgi:hypothetical protein